MSGMEPLVLAEVAPELMATMLPEMGAAAAGSTAAAMAPEMLAASMPAMAEMGGMSALPELAAGYAPFSSASSAYLAPLEAQGGMSSFLSQYPSMTGALQNTGLLGNVVDATGGLETATSAANNIGGGLLGKMGGGLAKQFSPQSMMLNGMKMAGQSMTQQPQQHAAPMPNLQAQQYQPLTAGNSSEEYRKKRDELLKRMLGMQ